jgi:hypothetical protein
MYINLFDIEFWESVTVILGVIVSTYSLFTSVSEYSKQGTQKRANYFFDLQRKFYANDTFKLICLLCENDGPALKEIPYKDKIDLLIFYEELALALNSKLIKKEVIYYMFGYYIIKCWKCNNLWLDLEKDSPYWKIFHELALNMKEIENKKLKYNNLKL